ncbi:MAG: XRE family transcriptional regulator [Phenylobacterium sp.]|uniref:helix-turn-helix domain-containing protein n=1 Tax=Phenylobacterium sp. TaxID=1871053 RepID=UPI00121CEA8D|nr:helix-turn-helix transcriptional regulator [Phenylobacterium sp.]TAJ71796.1 MAG: XRE family transcriptional regulator [Phenylobacterium sp.]
MPKTIFTGANQVIVEVLRQTRESAGLKQEELAARIGRDQSHISLVEGSQRRLDLVEFMRIARALDRDPVDLFNEVYRAVERSGHDFG